MTPELAQIVVYYPEGAYPRRSTSTASCSLYCWGNLPSCAPRQARAVESQFNDHPAYQETKICNSSMPSAQTYFIQVNPGTSGNTAAAPKSVQAEALLSKMHKQTKGINRASQVKTCDYVNNSGVVLIQSKSCSLCGQVMRQGFLLNPAISWTRW